jgi:isoquinoline 1-oxidoreductase beta subunit
MTLKAMEFKENGVIPVGYWRSVGHSHSAFAIECFMDELAHAAGIDPLSLRRLSLTKDQRALAVLNRVASLSGYEAQKKTSMGLARHSGWDSHCAMVVDIALGPDKSIRVQKVWVVVDCGFALQPDTIRAQMEGGVIFGLTAALKKNLCTMSQMIP